MIVDLSNRQCTCLQLGMTKNIGNYFNYVILLWEMKDNVILKLFTFDQKLNKTWN